MPRKIEVSHKTIIFGVFFVVLLWLLYLIRDIILQFFIALLIMAILNPFVTKLSKYKIPRAVSIIVVYVFSVALAGIAIAAIVPPLVEQTTSFINNLPVIVEGLGLSFFASENIVRQLISQLGSLPGEAARFTFSIFSNVLGVVAVLVFAFYLLLSREKLDNNLGVLFGKSNEEKVGSIIDKLENRLGGWARAQLTLMLVVGVTSYIGLVLLGIPFALPLSILAGLLEFVPFAGPIIAAIPAVIIGFGISSVMGIAVAALYFIIQQLENYLFVPKIMQHSTGVNPIITLLALAIGLRLAGVPGLLISVPVFLTVQVLMKEYTELTA
jgi:predicted PurR-regulated permease PerM